MRTLTTIATLAVLASACTCQTSANDLFDRPNSGLLGPDWIEIDGDATISGNQLQGNSPFTFGWSAHTVFQAPWSTTVVRARWAMNGGGGDRISLIAGVDPNTWAGIEVRIADNDGDGLADRIFFNAAVNAGNWFTGPTFFNLATPLASGTATLWFTSGGDTANVRLDSGGSSQSFSASGILTMPPTGTSVGLGYFGNGTVDDFRAWTGSPTAPSYTITPPRTQTAPTLLVTDATPNGAVLLAASTAGAGPTATFLGPVQLSQPIDVITILPTDAAGTAALTAPVIPPGAAGFVFYSQAVDLTALVVTNAFVATIL